VNENTAYQLTTLVTMVNQLLPFIAKGAVRKITDPDEHVELEGGVAPSAAVTAIKAFERIDTILGDDNRWPAKDVREVEDNVAAGVKAQRELMESQLAESKRPSMNVRPTVGYNPEQGQWVAFLEPRSESLVPVHGVGATPEEALKAFDEAFTGAAFNEEVQAEIDRQTKKLTKKSKSKPKPKPKPREETQAEFIERRTKEIREKTDKEGGIMLPAELQAIHEWQRLHRTHDEAEQDRRNKEGTENESEK
jgi:hypothetical protein